MNDIYLTDTHFHLDLTDDIDNILSRAKEAGVSNFIISGCDLKGINEGLEIIKKYDDVYLTIGFHPSETETYTNEEIKFLRDTVKNNKKIVGIGEIGLDYHYGKDDQLKQIEMFIDQMHLVQELGLPVVIHSRDATEDTIKILKEFPKVTGVIHCFSGSVETAKIYVKMGYKIGIGGVVSFSNS